MIKTVLSGHVSEETAFVVEDYPYGYKLRTEMKCWLHTDPKKGVRFMSRTLNPKTGRWNAPKASTYAFVSGGMYLDEEGHVQWMAFTPYTSAVDALAFVRAFPNDVNMPAIRRWCASKLKCAEQIASGTRYFTINGEKQERSEYQKAEDEKDAAAWREVVEALAPIATQQVTV